MCRKNMHKFKKINVSNEKSNICTDKWCVNNYKYAIKIIHLLTEIANSYEYCVFFASVFIAPFVL